MRTPRPQSFYYDIEKLQADMAEKGWLATDLARAAEMSDSTVHRFLTGHYQTARAIRKMATALGFTTRRYVVRRREAVSV